jgi:hypothetical protein
MRLNAAAGITLLDRRPAVALAFLRKRPADTPDKIKSSMRPEPSDAPHQDNIADSGKTDRR